MFVCSHHFSDECFVNKAQFDAGFADCLILKVGAVPVMKVPCHESETQAVSKTASNFCFVCSRHVSAYSASGKYSQHFTFCTFVMLQPYAKMNSIYYFPQNSTNNTP